MMRDLDTWLEWLAGVERRSPQTIRSYRCAVAAYIVHVRQRRRNVRRATVTDVASYVASIVGSDSTVSQRLYAVRSFHSWLVTQGLAKDNPARLVSPPRVPELAVPPPSRVEVAAVLAAHPSTPVGIRDRAIVAMLYGCGLRVSELRGLRLVDVDLVQRRVHVRGKGKRRRNVPIPKHVCEYVRDWLELRPDVGQLVFAGDGPDGMRAQESIYHAMKVAARRAGVRVRRIHPHAMRHAYACHLLAGGADLRTLQRLLGHASIQTTCRYLAIEIGDLERCVEAHHPLAGRQLVTSSLANPWSGWSPAA